MSETVADTWASRDLPILRAALRRLDGGGRGYPELNEIREELGFSADQMWSGIEALRSADPPYIDVQMRMGWTDNRSPGRDRGQPRAVRLALRTRGRSTATPLLPIDSHRPVRPNRHGLELLHLDRFVDCSPAQVYATLLDERAYLASERTMYRLLAAAYGSVRERRDQLSHPAYAKPELLARRPNEVWSWDTASSRARRSGPASTCTRSLTSTAATRSAGPSSTASPPRSPRR